MGVDDGALRMMAVDPFAPGTLESRGARSIVQGAPIGLTSPIRIARRETNVAVPRLAEKAAAFHEVERLNSLEPGGEVGPGVGDIQPWRRDARLRHGA